MSEVLWNSFPYVYANILQGFFPCFGLSRRLKILVYNKFVSYLRGQKRQALKILFCKMESL